MSSTTIVYGRESWQSRTRRSPWRESSLGTGTTTFFSWSLKTIFLSQHTSLWINAYFWQFAHLSMPFISLLITILAPTMHSGLCTSPVQFNCTPCIMIFHQVWPFVQKQPQNDDNLQEIWVVDFCPMTESLIDLHNWSICLNLRKDGKSNYPMNWEDIKSGTILSRWTNMGMNKWGKEDVPK